MKKTILIASAYSKSGDIIEPVLKPQWWVNCKPLAEEAIKASFVLFLADVGSYEIPEDQSRRVDDLPENL